jgi:hypothetical protein
MSDVTRICPQCGHANSMDARYCAQCAYDTQGNLPAPQASSLPAVVSKAALPVLVGAASLAVSLGWKLLQGMLAQQQKAQAQPIQVKKADLPATQAKRTIRIRTSWAVGDSSGQWQRGQTEHTIEFDD